MSFWVRLTICSFALLCWDLKDYLKILDGLGSGSYRSKRPPSCGVPRQISESPPAAGTALQQSLTFDLSVKREKKNSRLAQ